MTDRQMKVAEEVMREDRDLLAALARGGFQIDLPWPPSVNRIWRRGRGKTYKAPAYASWLEEAGWVLAAQVKQSQAISGRFKAKIILHPPDTRKIDLDNRIKVILDLVQHMGLIRDDSLCRHLDVGYDEDGLLPVGARLIVTPV